MATELQAEASTSRWGDIGRSWLAMKVWVKVWLFALNGVLLGSLAFWYDPVGRWTAVAYVAAGPLLMAFMLVQRGLTRLLGVAHLLPWIPLLGYLACRLTSDLAGPRLSGSGDPALFGYTIVVLVCVGVCCALDVYDLARWINGERFVLGSSEAFRAGASSHTLR